MSEVHVTTNLVLRQGGLRSPHALLQARHGLVPVPLRRGSCNDRRPRLRLELRNLNVRINRGE